MFWDSETIPVVDKKDYFGFENLESIDIGELINSNDYGFVTQYDSGNDRITSLFKNEKLLENFVQLLIKEYDDETQLNKVANSLCGLFTSKNDTIESQLINNPKILDLLIEYLKKDELVPIQASLIFCCYYSIYLKFNEAMIIYLQSKPEFFDLVISHINTFAALDFLFKVFSLDGLNQEPKAKAKIVSWLKSSNIIMNLINVFESPKDESFYENTTMFLTFSIGRTKQSPLLDSNFDCFYEEEIISKLVDNCINNESSVYYVLKIINNLLDFDRFVAINEVVGNHFQRQIDNKFSFNKIFGSFEYSVDVTFFDYIKRVKIIHNKMISNLNYFITLLSKKTQKETMKSTMGFEVEPLGFVKIEIINLFRSLIIADNPEMNDEILKLNVLKSVIDIFFNYKWNNVAHNYIVEIVKFLLINTDSKKKSKLYAKVDDMEKILSFENFEDLEQKLNLKLFDFMNKIWSEKEIFFKIKFLFKQDNEKNFDLENDDNENTKNLIVSKQLLNDCKIIENLTNYQTILNNEKDLKKPKLGFCAHLTLLGFIFHSSIKNLRSLYESLNLELSEEIEKKWESFINEDLTWLDKKQKDVNELLENEITAEKKYNYFSFVPGISTLFIKMPYNGNEFDECIKSFQTDLDKLTQFSSNFEEQFSNSFKALKDFNTEISDCEIDCKIPNLKNDTDDEFNENNLKEENISEAENKLSLTKISIDSMQVSSVNEKDNFFEPLASSSNISNELNIEMDSNIDVGLETSNKNQDVNTVDDDWAFFMNERANKSSES